MLAVVLPAGSAALQEGSYWTWSFLPTLCFWNSGACAVGVLWSGSLCHFWNRRKEPYLAQIKPKFSVKLLLFQIWERKISSCRQMGLVFLKCHRSKTVLGKQRGWKEIWMFLWHAQTLQSWMINAVSCYMAKTQGFSHPWILAEVFFGGSRQQCQNSSPSFNHYYCFIYTKVQHEKDPLPLKEPLQWCVTVCAEARICNGLLIRSSNKKNEVEACILFAVHLPASKKKKSPFLKHM